MAVRSQIFPNYSFFVLIALVTVWHQGGHQELGWELWRGLWQWVTHCWMLLMISLLEENRTLYSASLVGYQDFAINMRGWPVCCVYQRWNFNMPSGNCFGAQWWLQNYEMITLKLVHKAARSDCTLQLGHLRLLMNSLKYIFIAATRKNIPENCMQLIITPNLNGDLGVGSEKSACSGFWIQKSELFIICTKPSSSEELTPEPKKTTLTLLQDLANTGIFHLQDILSRLVYHPLLSSDQKYAQDICDYTYIFIVTKYVHKYRVSWKYGEEYMPIKDTVLNFISISYKVYLTLESSQNHTLSPSLISWALLCHGKEKEWYFRTLPPIKE